MMNTPMEVRCCVCTQPMDWNKRYGREACCCSRECYGEFQWRRSLSICGEAYRPVDHTHMLPQEGDP